MFQKLQTRNLLNHYYKTQKQKINLFMKNVIFLINTFKIINVRYKSLKLTAVKLKYLSILNKCSIFANSVIDQNFKFLEIIYFVKNYI